MEIIIADMKAGRAGEYGPISYDGPYIFLPNGLFIKYPNLHTVVDKETNWIETQYGTNNKIYPGLLFNNIIQSLARIVVAEQILRVPERYKKCIIGA